MPITRAEFKRIMTTMTRVKLQCLDIIIHRHLVKEMAYTLSQQYVNSNTQKATTISNTTSRNSRKHRIRLLFTLTSNPYWLQYNNRNDIIRVSKLISPVTYCLLISSRVVAFHTYPIQSLRLGFIYVFLVGKIKIKSQK